MAATRSALSAVPWGNAIDHTGERARVRRRGCRGRHPTGSGRAPGRQDQHAARVAPVLRGSRMPDPSTAGCFGTLVLGIEATGPEREGRDDHPQDDTATTRPCTSRRARVRAREGGRRSAPFALRPAPRPPRRRERTGSRASGPRPPCRASGTLARTPSGRRRIESTSPNGGRALGPDGSRPSAPGRSEHRPEQHPVAPAPEGEADQRAERGDEGGRDHAGGGEVRSAAFARSRTAEGCGSR